MPQPRDESLAGLLLPHTVHHENARGNYSTLTDVTDYKQLTKDLLDWYSEEIDPCHDDTLIEAGFRDVMEIEFNNDSDDDDKQYYNGKGYEYFDDLLDDCNLWEKYYHHAIEYIEDINAIPDRFKELSN